MIDICLKFASEKEAIAAMPQFRSDEGWILASHTHALDPIGTLYNEGVPSEGWHVNIRLLTGEIPEALTPYRVEPQTQKRVWANERY